MKSKPSSQVTYYASGVPGKPAPQSAPSPVAERGIAGFARMKTASASTGPSGAGTPNPTEKVTARGYNPPTDGTKCKPKPGGPSRAGPSGTQGGTSSPKHGSGPSGLGLAGSKFPPIG